MSNSEVNPIDVVEGIPGATKAASEPDLPAAVPEVQRVTPGNSKSPRTVGQREQHRRRIAEALFKGESLCALARDLGLNVKTVRQDAKGILLEWHEEQMQLLQTDWPLLRARLEYQYLQAVRGWEDSAARNEPDPRFLVVMLKIWEQRKAFLPPCALPDTVEDQLLPWGRTPVEKLDAEIQRIEKLMKEHGILCDTSDEEGDSRTQ